MRWPPAPKSLAAQTKPGIGNAQTRSVIDPWLTITGTLESEGEIHVEGRVDGDIRCAHLTVGKDAKVNGNITAEALVIRGEVKGTIRANSVTLLDSSGVESEIFHKSLSIEEGARFEGQSRRSPDPIKDARDGHLLTDEAATTGPEA